MNNRKRLLILLGLALLAAAVLVPALAEEAAGDAATAEVAVPFINTFWALVPPIIAILLALITKEVYSSLFVGIA